MITATVPSREPSITALSIPKTPDPSRKPIFVESVFETDLPLGTTTVDGTINACIMPTGVSVQSMVRCWASDAMPDKPTCAYQSIKNAETVTLPPGLVTACSVDVTVKGTTVVMPSQTLPNYDATQPTVVSHTPVAVVPQTVEQPSLTPTNSGVPVVFLTTAVVIQSSTITFNGVQPTDGFNLGVVGSHARGPDQVVTVGSNTFTVNPSQVIGMGTTVNKPYWAGDDDSGNGGVYAAQPTSTVLNGMSVQVSGHSVQIDGTAFSIPSQPSAGIVHGTQTVYLGPDGVVAGGETLRVSPIAVSAGGNANGGNGATGVGSGGQVGGSEVVVAGGTVLTMDDTHIVANGQTIVYNGATPTVLTVAGDTITIVPPASPNGGGSAHVVIHGTTMAAPASGSTHYEMIGGATFTELNPSVVVLNGHSYTVGAAAAKTTDATGGVVGGATPTTTVVGGETVTIGTDGVTVGGSLTFKYPFMTAPTITITPKASTAGMAEATTASDNGPKTPVGGSQSNGNIASGSSSKNAASQPLVAPVLALSAMGSMMATFLFAYFKDIGAPAQKAFARYFGPLQVHPVGAHVKDHLEFHNIYMGPDNEYRARRRDNRLATRYEHQPPGITLLTLLSVPPVGSNTAWASATAAYVRLSPPIQALLEGLRAEHGGFPQAESARAPGDGQKSLFVNPGFTKRIMGLKNEESDALLQLLSKHITYGQEFQVRVKWEEGTVALWDNWVTSHTVISDYNVYNPQEGLRHSVWLTTLADKPSGVRGLESTW
ncbi:hypothetical protein SBRCBS47491_005454 [Sporothrix bragantina]|uniref:TauD/TfdA-like domain-containing protein n=1 Tax=Sporothrix bragantina TaxID=671064 RepID=A0ABP0BXH4_9PEZI